jgi:WD40 repeat protein
LAFSPNSRILAVGTGILPDGGKVRLFDLDRKAKSAFPEPEEVRSLVFSRDAGKLAVGKTKQSSVLEALSGRPLVAPINGVPIAFSADGSSPPPGSGQLTTQLKSIRLAAAKSTCHDATIAALAFSPDDTLLATASADRTARIVDLSTGAERARITHDVAMNAVAFSPDGQLIAAASDDGTARLWSTDFDSILKRLCSGPGCRPGRGRNLVWCDLR